MPTKTTDKGREYDIKKGRFLVWHAEVWEDEGETPFDITLPLRIKLKVVRAIGTDAEMDADAMMKVLNLLVPDQSEALEEMDLNDFQEMFTTWQAEYEQLNGASLGESAGSSR